MIDNFDYETEAFVTKPGGRWHGHLINGELFNVAIDRAIEALQVIDEVKKTLFYGRPLPVNSSIVTRVDNLLFSDETCRILPTLPEVGENFDVAVDRIHSILGVASEAGELLEALRNALDGQFFDKTNAAEEAGDVFWYLNLLAGATGSNFDQIQRANIAKLRVRFPNKFTEFDANNRNLDNERKVLEKSA
jgi:NTP pyrophosphatase (non-canonical NTP hydrolase)